MDFIYFLPLRTPTSISKKAKKKHTKTDINYFSKQEKTKTK